MVDTPLRFQGQYFDEETGLHYNRHRYYNPSTGCFLTPDPIKLTGGINNYQYVPNPINWIDPLGLRCLHDTISVEQQQEARRRIFDEGGDAPELPGNVSERFPNARQVSAEDAMLLTRWSNAGPNAPDFARWTDPERVGGNLFYDLDSDSVIYATDMTTSTRGHLNVAVPYRPSAAVNGERLPDFTGYIDERVEIDMQGGPGDYRPAWTQLAEDRSEAYINNEYGVYRNSDGEWPQQGQGSLPPIRVWHHFQDLRTMMLIDYEIHDLFKHLGGTSLLKKNK